MNPLSLPLHPGMCRPRWDPAAFGKAFGGRTGALQPSHPTAGSWEVSPLAELLLGPLAAPAGLDPSFPRNCCSRSRESDPGPLGPAMLLPPHKYFSSEKACQLPSVSGTWLRGRSPLHRRGAGPRRIQSPSFPCLCSGRTNALHRSCPAGVLAGSSASPHQTSSRGLSSAPKYMWGLLRPEGNTL